MSNRYFLFTLLSVLLVFLGAGQVQAQNCTIDYELIFKMSDPFVGSYNVWDTLYGEQDTNERFKSGVFEKGGWLIAAGERAKKDGDEIDLTLVALGRRGRKHWEKVHTVKGLYEVKKIIAEGDGFIVLGNVKNAKGKEQVWLGFIAKDGSLTGQKIMKDKHSGMVGTDIIRAHDGKNFMLATQFLSPDEGRLPHSAVHKITPKGVVKFGPAFLPGAENRIESLQAADKDYYIAVGYIRTAKGRKAGWIMRLNEQAGVDWQRQYPRGRGSELVSSAHLSGDIIVTTGKAYPALGSDQNVAGWVMAVGVENGDIGWQRYYTGDIHYSAEDVLINDDGMISVLLDGSPSPDKEQDYVRLLTINPRGQLFISNEYFNGEGADGHEIIRSPSGERVILGATKMKYTIEGPTLEEPEIKRSQEGWVLVAEAAEPYIDPCIQPFAAVP